MDACVDRFEVCAMLSKAILHFLRLTVAQTSVLEMRPHSHELYQQCRTCEHVACSRLFSCLSHSQLRETAPPTSSPCSLLVLPCTFIGFWTGAGLWQSDLFAETIPQFEFSVLSLVAEPFWMTSQRQVLPSMEKVLMYDYGATAYVEMCTFSIVYRSTKLTVIDWNTLYCSLPFLCSEYHRAASFTKASQISFLLIV